MNHLASHLAPHAASNVASVLLAIVIFAVLLGYALLAIGALVSVLRSPQSGGMKLVWCVFVFLAPFLGSLLWFLIGRPNAAGPGVYG